MQTIVIGHRNPDMDSICSAIGYARFKQLSGNPDAIAARAGDTNDRIDYVLRKFGVEAPVFIADLSPRVSDVMERNVVSVRRDSSAYDAIHLIERERLRGLPVIDEQNRCLGLLSAFRVCQQLFPARDQAAGGGWRPGRNPTPGACGRRSLARRPYIPNPPLESVSDRKHGE